MKMLFSYMLLAAVLLLSSCTSGKDSAGKTSANSKPADVTAEATTVSVVKAERREITDQLSLAGVVTPDEQVTLYAKVSGYLKSISVDIGDWVRQGQLLAQIDVPEMVTSLEEKRAALLKAEADVVKAQADVEQAEADVGFQKLNYERLKSIHDKDPDILPENEVDQARAVQGVANGKVQAAKAQVRVASAAVESARAEIKTLTTVMEYAKVTAPISGVVSERFVDSGALIQAAATSRTQAAPIVSVAGLDKIRIVVDVPEPKVRYVKAGTKATLQVDALPGESFTAEVARTGIVLDMGNRTMRVEFDVPNRQHRLRPGMTASLSLELQRFDNAITVPVSALHTQGKSRTVFVVEQGKAIQRQVRTGLESPEWIQVTEGLSGGEEVIVASSTSLTNDAKVKVSQ